MKNLILITVCILLLFLTGCGESDPVKRRAYNDASLKEGAVLLGKAPDGLEIYQVTLYNGEGYGQVIFLARKKGEPTVITSERRVGKVNVTDVSVVAD